MPSLFSWFRIAPGVRLSTSRRGLRAHVGPRVARVHLGGGRPGVSTGGGPFTLYESLGSGASRTSSQSGDKAALHRRVTKELAALGAVHQAEFAAAQPISAPRPKLPKFGKLLATAEKQQLREVSRFDRGARKEGRSKARQQAEGWALDLMRLAEAEVRAEQEGLDRQWRLLCDNDAPTVGKALSAAFAESGTPAQVLGLDDAVLSIRVVGPTDNEVPQTKPTLTPSGAPSVARMNKTDRAAWEAEIVASRVLLVAKQACAVAPGLSVVRLVVVRPESGEPILACAVGRDRLLAADFRKPAWKVLQSVVDDVVAKPRGRSRQLGGLSLARTEFADLA